MSRIATLAFRSRQSSVSQRLFSTSLAKMAKLDINSKLRMNSGYEIPMLGYGVYQT